MRQRAPIVVQPVISAWLPIEVPAPRVTCGPTTAPGPIVTPAPSRAPGSTNDAG